MSKFLQNEESEFLNFLYDVILYPEGSMNFKYLKIFARYFANTTKNKKMIFDLFDGSPKLCSDEASEKTVQTVVNNIKAALELRSQQGILFLDLTFEDQEIQENILFQRFAFASGSVSAKQEDILFYQEEMKRNTFELLALFQVRKAVQKYVDLFLEHWLKPMYPPTGIDPSFEKRPIEQQRRIEIFLCHRHEDFLLFLDLFTFVFRNEDATWYDANQVYLQYYPKVLPDKKQILYLLYIKEDLCSQAFQRFLLEKMIEFYVMELDIQHQQMNEKEK